MSRKGISAEIRQGPVSLDQMVIRSKKEVWTAGIELYCHIESQLNALRCPSEFNGTGHIHLLVHGHEDQDVIPRSLQLIAGRTGQEYNQRKKRKGAFWEDRYHATAVDVDEHLVRCLVYIDMNMVRARVVRHPREWSHGGYPEIIEPQQRYRIINRGLLKRLLDVDKDFSEVYSGWAQAAVDERTPRQAGWTESVAVGCKDFVEKIKEMLGGRACGRRVHEVSKTGSYALKEPVLAYNDVFDGKKGLLSFENRLIWEIYPDI